MSSYDLVDRSTGDVAARIEEACDGSVSVSWVGAADHVPWASLGDLKEQHCHHGPYEVRPRS